MLKNKFSRGAHRNSMVWIGTCEKCSGESWEVWACLKKCYQDMTAKISAYGMVIPVPKCLHDRIRLLVMF